nr:unnamed protein product [Callosobruchus analis]
MKALDCVIRKRNRLHFLLCIFAKNYLRYLHGFINSSPIVCGSFCFAIIKAISNEALRCCGTLLSGRQSNSLAKSNVSLHITSPLKSKSTDESNHQVKNVQNFKIRSDYLQDGNIRTNKVKY